MYRCLSCRWIEERSYHWEEKSNVGNGCALRGDNARSSSVGLQVVSRDLKPSVSCSKRSDHATSITNVS